MFRTHEAEVMFVDSFRRMADSLEKLVSRNEPPVSVQNFDDIRAYLRVGEKIKAIKLFRTLTGAGLKDAKDQIDALQERESRFGS
jgi:ribosomal protein L7/L12